MHIYIYKEAEPCVSVCLDCEVNPTNPCDVFVLGIGGLAKRLTGTGAALDL